MKPLFILALTLFIGAAAHAQKAPLRTLIISGGPNFQFNQYAIESNARYVEGLTQNSRWRRIHFADGSAQSRTVAAYETAPTFRAQRALAWILNEPLPENRIVARASTLKQIDGASTKPSVLRVLAEFAQPAPDERGLLYFTGHGNAGGSRERPDYQNTTFALWNDDKISQREVAAAIRQWPRENPLFVVAVQCHSGGFSNLLFEDGDPQKPLLNRDIAGFFSSTGQRIAAGCTPEVNERDYQDFTTHFFAALSGTSRDGRQISGADFDRDGRISGSEAFAWANVNDLSIDVPVATSDAYLRAILPPENDDWQKIGYAQVKADAAPWQVALLDGLSAKLGLRGEARVADAMAQYRALQRRSGDEVAPVPGVDERALGARLQSLKSQIKTRFPVIDSPQGRGYDVARQNARRWLQGRPDDIAFLDDALAKFTRAQSAAEVREAMLERFARAVYTIALQNRLNTEGTPTQKAAFARIRAAEARNPIK